MKTVHLTLAVVLLFLFAGVSHAQVTTLYTFDGLAAGDGFGLSVAGAGDVNQDGWADLIVGAYNADPGSLSDAGQATVFSGKNGGVLHTFNGLAAGDWFGWSVAGAGDVNKDGYPDLIVGAYNADPGSLSNAGQATVFSGKNGNVLHTFNGLAAGDEFGIAVAGADVNQDGHADLIVGAYSADPGGRKDAGQVTVFSGKTGVVLYTFDGLAAGDRFGMSVWGAADVNRDGFPDVIVGAHRADPGGRADAGQATVFSGKTGSVLYTFDGPGIGDHFGRSVGAADVNRDGYAEVIVGADNASPRSRTGAGQATVLSGKDGHVLFTWDGPATGDCFGVSVAGAGDVDRDGWADVIVGADMADPGSRKDAGQATVFSPRGISTLSGTGSRRIGETMTLGLDAPGDGNLPYQVGSSLSAGSIPIDTRLLYLGPDVLLVVSVQGLLPGIFSGYAGVLDSGGKAAAAIHTPNVAALAGVRIHSAFVTLKPGAPSGLESISNTYCYDVTR